MSKHIVEETPAKGSHAQGDNPVEKQASQLAYDVKYKVKQQLNKGTKLNPAQVAKAYMAQLAKSPAPPAVKAMAKKKPPQKSHAALFAASWLGVAHAASVHNPRARAPAFLGAAMVLLSTIYVLPAQRKEPPMADGIGYALLTAGWAAVVGSNASVPRLLTI